MARLPIDVLRPGRRTGGDRRGGEYRFYGHILARPRRHPLDWCCTSGGSLLAVAPPAGFAAQVLDGGAWIEGLRWDPQTAMGIASRHPACQVDIVIPAQALRRVSILSARAPPLTPSLHFADTSRHRQDDLVNNLHRQARRVIACNSSLEECV